MRKVVVLAVAAAFMAASGAAQAQTYGYSYGHGNVQSGSSFGGGSAFGGGSSFGSGTSSGYVGPTGSYFYPGFGWSSRPLGGGNVYGGGVYGNGYGNGYGTPIYQAPVAVPGVRGYFRIGGVQAQYWQAPSGYYYPWGVGASTYGSPVYYVNQGVTQQSRPPLSSVFNDMEKYLDESKDRARVSQADFDHLFRRLHDLRGKYDNMLSQAGGTIEQADEDSVRRDVDQLSGEIAMRVKSTTQK